MSNADQYHWMYPVPSPISCLIRDADGVIRTREVELFKQLGYGGMAEVYAAKEINGPDGKRLFAIKISTAQMADQTGDLTTEAERFMKEARIASRIKHENVVNVIDVGVTPDGAMMIVMEYVPDGMTLSHLVYDRKKTGAKVTRWNATTKAFEEVPKTSVCNLETEFFPLALQILDGVEAGHRIGVLHRDLKPQNVLLLKKKSGALRAKISDFGIAKPFTEEAKQRDGSTLTQTGSIIGTIQYMSPQQLSRPPGYKYDERVDVWAIGVMFYEMVTGVRPFDDPSDQDAASLQYRICHFDPPPMSNAVKNPDPGLEELIRKALARDPRERIRNIAEFRERLVQVIDARMNASQQGAPSAPTTRVVNVEEPDVPQFVAEADASQEVTPDRVSAARVTHPSPRPRSGASLLVWLATAAIGVLGAVVWVLARPSSHAEKGSPSSVSQTATQTQLAFDAPAAEDAPTAQPTVSVSSRPVAQSAPKTGQPAKDWAKAQKLAAKGDKLSLRLAVSYADLVIANPAYSAFPNAHELVGDAKRKMNEKPDACKAYLRYLDINGAAPLPKATQAFVDGNCPKP